MDDLRMIGIGASAGGVEALLEIVAGVDAGLDAVVLVVLHQADGGPSVLADVLDRRSPLPVTTARDGARLVPARIVVAPPDAHLLVSDRCARLDRGPKENGHRPGIDPLFRSLARSAGAAATGVVLSGLLDDGASGLHEIVRRGGRAVVQDPEDALHADMPVSALARVPHARVLPARDIAGALGRRTPERGRTDTGGADDAGSVW